MIRINLAPAEVRRRRAGFKLPELRINLGIIFVVVYVLAGAGVGWWWWGLMADEQRLADEIQQMNTENDTLKAKVTGGANVQGQLNEAKRRVQVIDELTKGQARPIMMLDAFADVMPRDVWITGLEDRGSVLRVSGSAFSTTAVADLMKNMRTSGKFRDVDIVVSKQDLTKSQGLVTFEVTCRFEG